jgi:hypothetical protein
VHSVGVPAEICDQLSCGVRFAAREELPGALEKAMSASPPAATDPQLKSFSWPAYVDRVRRVAAGEAPVAPGIEPPTPAAIAPSRRALVIVGCHRSGTSAMARTLGLAGAALPARLMEPAPDNPTGFWEPREISGLNDRLLGSIGCAWHDVAAAGRAQRRDLLDTIFLPQARELVHEEYADAPLIALKDPRISLLAPFWDDALLGEGFGACFVIMVRSPFEVAASLHARNGIALDKGLLLWGTYLLAAERDTRDRPRVFVAFEDLLRDPAGALRRVGSTLDVALGVAAMEEIARYLDAGLNHFTDSGWAADARYRPIQALYDAALGACRSPAFDHAAWSRGAAGFEDLLRWVDAAV